MARIPPAAPSGRPIGKVNVSAETVWHDIEGSLALYHSGTGCYFELDEAGAEIWRHLSKGLTIPEVVERLAADHAGDPAAMAVDARGLVEELLELGLLVEADRPSARRP